LIPAKLSIVFIMHSKSGSLFQLLVATVIAALVGVGFWVSFSGLADAGPELMQYASNPGQESAARPAAEFPVDPSRIEVAHVPPRPEASIRRAERDSSLHPDAVILPTIGGNPANKEQSQYLRMLVHAMAGAGLSLDMPGDIPENMFSLLESWTEPLLSERATLSKHGAEMAQQFIRDRLSAGLSEVTTTPPTSWPPSEVVGWRHAKDAGGRDVYHVVRIRGGDVPRIDYIRDRSNAIDGDMAALARGLFDRLRKQGG